MTGQGGARRAAIRPLVLTAAASQAQLVVLAPTLPGVARELGVSVGVVGQARAITAVVAIAEALRLLARRRSTRRLAARGAGVSIVGCIAVAVAPAPAWFLAAHVLVGIGFADLLSAGFGGVAAFAVESRARVVGLVAAGNASAWVVAAPAAGVISDTATWRVAELVPAVAAVLVLTSARAIPATSASPGSARAIRQNAGARRWVAGEALAYAGWSALLTFVVAFLVQRLHTTASTAGAVLAMGAAAYAGASTCSGRLAARVPQRTLLVGSTVFMAVLVVVLLLQTSSMLAGAILFWLVGACAGVRTPGSAALGLQQLRGEGAMMMTARTAATQTGYLVGAVAGGIVISVLGYAALGGTLAIALLASARLLARVPQRGDRVVPSGAGDGSGRSGAPAAAGQAELPVRI